MARRARGNVRPSDAASGADGGGPALPGPIADWFAGRGWQPRAHQLSLIARAQAGHDTLLIAPTGAGKTLAGFLPSLIELTAEDYAAPRQGSGLHTLYISPLKALAVDIHRNLTTPVEEMGLDITIETRSGDTSSAKRQRQRTKPPHILLTTPEQLALLLAHEDGAWLFKNLRQVVLDELHALAPSKRGDLLALGLARLRAIAPGVRLTGLSATVARPSELRAFLSPQRAPDDYIALADLVTVQGGVEPDIEILEGDDPLPWAGHTARYAVGRMYEAIKAHRLSLVFVNTRSQAEMMFQELWRINEDDSADRVASRIA